MFRFKVSLLSYLFFEVSVGLLDKGDDVARIGRQHRHNRLRDHLGEFLLTTNTLHFFF